MRRTAALRRLARTAVAAAATLLVAASLALPALRPRTPAAPPKGPTLPSYVVPNLIAGGMSLAVLAIACKRPRQQ